MMENYDYEIPYIMGESKPVFDPKPHWNNDTHKWFINDHCFIEDINGVLHVIGINNPYPDDMTILYDYHPYLGHGISNDPMNGFHREPFAIDDSQGAEYLGAPYILWLEEQQRYVMIFESKIDGTRVLEVAFSNDLYTWERQQKSILTELGWTKRDPCIIKKNDIYYIYLCNPQHGMSAVSVSETKDFITFSNSRNCLEIKDGTNWGGIESPFILERKGLYYLFFTYAHKHYTETIVCVSHKMDQFSMDNVVTTLYGHASEIFQYRGKMYISSCGPEDIHALNTQGLYLAELSWLKKA